MVMVGGSTGAGALPEVHLLRGVSSLGAVCYCTSQAAMQLEQACAPPPVAYLVPLDGNARLFAIVNYGTMHVRFPLPNVVPRYHRASGALPVIPRHISTEPMTFMHQAVDQLAITLPHRVAPASGPLTKI